MSDSFHVNITHIRGKSAKELDEMAKDPDSLLSQWTLKKATKSAVRKSRKKKVPKL